jgi:hypothetical protein
MKRLHRLSVITLLVCLIFSLIAMPAIAAITINQNPGIADLYGVNASSPNNNDILVYDAGSGLWVNNNSLSIIFGDITNLVNYISFLNATQISQGNNITLLLGYVSALQSLASAINTTLNGAVINITALQSLLAALNSTVVGMQGDVSVLQGNVTAIASNVSTILSQMSALNSTVIANTNAISSLNSTVLSNSGNITELKNFAFVICANNGTSALSPGLISFYQPVPFDCNITGWILIADQSGSIVIDVWADTYAHFPPTVADTIAGSEKPILSAIRINEDLSLGTWTTSLSAGDILFFYVDSCSTITSITLTILATRVV